MQNILDASQMFHVSGVLGGFDRACMEEVASRIGAGSTRTCCGWKVDRMEGNKYYESREDGLVISNLLLEAFARATESGRCEGQEVNE